ncbi:GAR2 protein, partial [Spelaeornis formosus]|nr:GAR2 protein [Elachura formosa]
GEDEPTTTVFVGQLSWNVDNDWLQSEFESCGEIVSAKVMMDQSSGRSRGFGFVTFTSLEGSAKAIE